MPITAVGEREVARLGLSEQEVFANIGEGLLLPLADIAPNDYNPKTCMDARLVSIAKSLKQHGWQPHDLGLVWEDPQGPTRYTLLNGEHRWMICKFAGFTRYPAIVREPFATRDDAVSLVMALEDAKARRDGKKFANNLLRLAEAGKDEELRGILRVSDPDALRLLAQQRRERTEAASEVAQATRANPPRIVSFTLTAAQHEALQEAFGKAKTRLKQAETLVGIVDDFATREWTEKEIVAIAAVSKHGR